jgi:integrase
MTMSSARVRWAGASRWVDAALRSSRRFCAGPPLRLHDLRPTHATLLLKAGVPINVVSERLGHGTPGFTMATYQPVLPGMQAEAARTFAAVIASTGFSPVEDPIDAAVTR